MTFLTLQPSEVVGVIKESLGEPSQFITIDIPPVVATRPRISKWGAYYGKRYTKWMKDVEETLKTSMSSIDTPCTVIVEQICQKPKTTKLNYPNGDSDNYVKAPLDALTKKEYWTDDNIITGHWCSKRFAKPGEAPRTEVSIYVHQEPYKN